MTLNGWQRLWVMATVLWAPGLFTVLAYWDPSIFSDPGVQWDKLLTALLVMWLVSSLVVYAFGLGVRWVVKGFRT